MFSELLLAFTIVFDGKTLIHKFVAHSWIHSHHITKIIHIHKELKNASSQSFVATNAVNRTVAKCS